MGEVINQLSYCVLSQETYGKQGAGDIKVLAKIFLEDLKEFPAEEIIKGIFECRQTQDKFVTIAAVRRIITKEKTFDKAAYMGFLHKAKVGDYLSDEERRYMRDYENKAIKNNSGN